MVATVEMRYRLAVRSVLEGALEELTGDPLPFRLTFEKAMPAPSSGITRCDQRLDQLIEDSVLVRHGALDRCSEGCVADEYSELDVAVLG